MSHVPPFYGILTNTDVGNPTAPLITALGRQASFTRQVGTHNRIRPYKGTRVVQSRFTEEGNYTSGRQACHPRKGESHPDTGEGLLSFIFTGHQSGSCHIGRLPEDPIIQDSLIHLVAAASGGRGIDQCNVVSRCGCYPELDIVLLFRRLL